MTSLADQERAIRELAAKLGTDVAEWFRDEGASGATVAARPAFRALLQYCAQHPRPTRAPGHVLVLNASRFGRFDDPDQAAALRFQLRQSGWLVRFVESDVETDDTVARSVMRAVGDAQASEYRRNIIRNAQRGRRGASELGYWTGREPYGYRRQVVHPAGRERILDPGQRKASDEKVKLVPYEPEAAVMRWTFEEFASGRRSLGKLVQVLNTRAPERTWSRAVLRVMLTNETYLGTIVYGRRSAQLWRQGIWRTDPSTWLRVPEAHPPLIGRELFDRVQQRLRTFARRPRSSQVDYRLTGVVRCATCGSPLIGGGLGGRFADGRRNYVYKCSGGVYGRCPGKINTVSRHLLEDAAIAVLARELAGPAVRAAIRRAVTALATPAARDGERAALVQALRQAEARRDRLVHAVAHGALTVEEARPVLEAVRAEMAELQAQVDTLRTPAPADPATLQQELLGRALDVARTASKLTGPELRDALAPWLVSATFDKHSRELGLRLAMVPMTLLVGGPHSDARLGSGRTGPGQCAGSKDGRAPIREIRVVVGPRRRCA